MVDERPHRLDVMRTGTWRAPRAPAPDSMSSKREARSNGNLSLREIKHLEDDNFGALTESA